MADQANKLLKENIELTRGVQKANADLSVQLNDSIKKWGELLTVQTNLNKQLKATTSVKAQSNAQRELTNNIKATALAEKEQLKIEQEAEKLKRQKIQTAQKEAQAEAKKRKETEALNSTYKKKSATLNTLRNDAKNLGAQFGINSKQFKAAAKDVNKLDKELKDIDRSLGQNQRSVGSYSDALGNLGGGIGMAVSGFVNMTKASLAFIATPIGAIIGAIGLAIGALTQYFKGSEEGQNAFNKISKITGVILGNLSDIVQSVGKAIFDAFSNPQQAMEDMVSFLKDKIKTSLQGLVMQFEAVGKILEGVFELDFDKVSDGVESFGSAVVQTFTGTENAIGKAKDAMAGLIDETKKEIDIANYLADLEAKRDLLQRKLIVDQEKLRADSRALRLKAEQTEGEERIRLLREAFAVEDELDNRRTEIAEINLRLKRESNKLSNSTKEDLTEEAELEAALYQIQQERLKAQRTLQTQINTEVEKANVNRLKMVDEISKSIESSNDDVYNSMEAESDRELALFFATEEAKTKKQEEEAQKREDIRKQWAEVGFEAAEAIANVAFENAQQRRDEEMAAELLAFDDRLANEKLDDEQRQAIEKEKVQREKELRKKNAKANKRDALFQVAINTAIGVTKAIAASPPPVNIPLIAFQVAAGAIQAAAISARKIPEFDKGTKSAPKGGFIAGEKGRELMINKGKVELIDTPTLFGNDYAGAEIISTKETSKLINNSINNDIMSADVNSRDYHIAKAVNDAFEKHSSKMVAEMRKNRPAKQKDMSGMERMKLTNEIIRNFKA